MFLVEGEARCGRQLLRPRRRVVAVDLGQGLQHVTALPWKARCDLDELSAAVRQAVGDDGIEVARGVVRDRVAHLNGRGESGGPLGEDSGQVFAGVLAAGEVQRHIARPRARDDSCSVHAGARLALLVFGEGRLAEGEQRHGRVVVVHDLALRRLPDQLLVCRADRLCGGVYQLPLCGRGHRHTQIALQLLDAVEGQPTAGNDTSWGQRVSWRLLVYNWMYRTLRNPTYAEAYALGRRETRTTLVEGAVHKSKGHDRARERWLVLLPDHHEGYIDWQTYERNQQRIADNAQTSAIMAKGAVREGQSLLCGLLLCGHCGRRMNVAYGGKRQRVPRYHCGVPRASHGTAACISFGGWRVDQAVESEVLAVLQPGAIEAALATAGHCDADWEQRRRALELEVREARYEAGRAQRQYDSVEPEKRLVAETLEQRWNEALAKVAQLDQRLEALDTEREQHVAPGAGDSSRASTVADERRGGWRGAGAG